jgi:hypothetical protein
VYGTHRCVEVDLDARLIRLYRPPSTRGPFAKIEVPILHVREAAGSLASNLRRFARSDLHYFTGMNRLFDLFYRAIREGGEPPIPYSEIRRVTSILDQIFRCCRGDDDARV